MRALGPAAGIILLERDGLGVPTKPALDPFGAARRLRRKYRVPGPQWFSPLAYYQGPFSETAGLHGSSDFFQRVSINDQPPNVYLTATQTGLGVVPVQLRWARGRQDVLLIPYAEIERIELRPATRARLIWATPTTSSRLGQVIVTTKDERTARLTGTTVGQLSQFLVALGAIIET